MAIRDDLITDLKEHGICVFNNRVYRSQAEILTLLPSDAVANGLDAIARLAALEAGGGGGGGGGGAVRSALRSVAGYDTGLTTVSYQFYDSGGSAVGSAVTTGITESTLVPGTYFTTVTFPGGFTDGSMIWNDGSGNLVQDFLPPLASFVASRTTFRVVTGYDTGLTTLSYQLYDNGGSALGSAVTTGIVESTLVPGTYSTTVTFPGGFAGGSIVWNDGSGNLVQEFIP